MKSNLYKVEAIACERNGMGVPLDHDGSERFRGGPAGG